MDQCEGASCVEVSISLRLDRCMREPDEREKKILEDSE